MAGSVIQVVVKFNHIPRWNAKAQADAKAAVRKASFGVQTTAVTSMAPPKHGRLYGSHQASAPGEPPAIDTGQLANSITVEIEPDGLTGWIGKGMSEYAVFLEYGTTRMAARPFMTPAAEHERGPFEAAMRQIGR